MRAQQRSLDRVYDRVLDVDIELHDVDLLLSTQGFHDVANLACLSMLGIGGRVLVLLRVQIYKLQSCLV